MSFNKEPAENALECKICSAPASNINYGVPSCPSCKMFFERNAHFGLRYLQCRFHGHCDVNVISRQNCASCRLKKCLLNGMRIEYFRPPRMRQRETSRYVTTSLTPMTDLRQTTQLPTLNLLQSDNSSLSRYQWTLLSNLLHSYDESKLLNIAQQIINDDVILPGAQMSNPILTQEFFKKTYETTGTYLLKNRDLLVLSPDDRCTVLRRTADTVHCLSSIFVWVRSRIYVHQLFLRTCQYLYGEQLVEVANHVMKFMDPDIVVAKLSLSLFAFSNSVLIYTPNSAIYSTTIITMFRIQNAYAEITWKYLLYKYGYYQAVRRFNILIQCLLAATNIVTGLQDVQIHKNDIESLVEHTEISLIMENIE